MQYALLRLFHRKLITVSCVVLAMMSTACGLTGNTSKFVVDVRSAQAKGPVTISTIELEPNQSRLVNVGTYAWGKYGSDDLDTLTRSMNESAANLRGPSPYAIHVVLRRFLVATGGSDGIALACVSWALTSPDGQLAYHEQFYASRHVNTFGTVGGIKDTVHEAIARRVLGRSSAIAAAPGTNAFESVRPDHSFDSFEEAIRDLPPTLTATSVKLVQLGNGYHQIVLGRGATQSADLSWVRQPEHLDWPSRLAAQPSTR
jgi:hypothetical protein